MTAIKPKNAIFLFLNSFPAIMHIVQEIAVVARKRNMAMIILCMRRLFVTSLDSLFFYSLQFSVSYPFFTIQTVLDVYKART
jgi:hypothetical protein